MKRLIFSTIAFGSLVLFPVTGHACGCFPSMEAVTGKKEPVRKLVLEEKKKSTAVFSGKVLTITGTRNAFLEVKLKVERMWKGDVVEEIVVFTPDSESTCGYTFEVGQSYLVYAGNVAGDLWTNHCTRTGRLAIDVNDDLRVLGKGRVPRKRASVKG